MFWIMGMICLVGSCGFPAESRMIFATQQACEKHLPNLPSSIEGWCKETDTIVIDQGRMYSSAPWSIP